MTRPMLWAAGWALLAGCTGEPAGVAVDGPDTSVLLSEQEARDAAEFSATLRKPYDPAYRDSWIEAREGLRNLAFLAMLRMPPDEFRAFHMRNGWVERWPELWGPVARVPLGFAGPPAAPGDWNSLKARVLEPILALYDDGDVSTRRIFRTRARAEQWVQDIFNHSRKHLAEYIEEHARRWPEAEDMWRPGRLGKTGGMAWKPEWLPEALERERLR